MSNFPTGKGRGVVADQSLQPGDVVMVCPPVAILTAKTGGRPDPELLVDTIIDSKIYSGPWFNYLYDGSAKSTQAIPDLPAMMGVRGGSGGPAPPQEMDQGQQQEEQQGASEQAQSPEAAPAAGSAGPAGAGAKRKVATVKSRAGLGFKGRQAAVKAAKQAATGGLDRQGMRRVAKMVKFNCFGKQLINIFIIRPFSNARYVDMQEGMRANI